FYPARCRIGLARRHVNVAAAEWTFLRGSGILGREDRGPAAILARLLNPPAQRCTTLRAHTACCRTYVVAAALAVASRIARSVTEPVSHGPATPMPRSSPSAGLELARRSTNCIRSRKSFL